MLDALCILKKILALHKIEFHDGFEFGLPMFRNLCVTFPNAFKDNKTFFLKD